jgi:hypothetical protein
MQDQSHEVPQEDIERARALVMELCREVAPDVQVTVRESLDIVLAWGGRERHVEVPYERLAALAQDPQPLRLDLEEAVQDLRRRGATTPAETSADLSDREALDRTKDLARHIVALLEPEATVAFEEYRWHGELTLDITVSLHGHEQHLEIGASRARIILPDYEWELRRNDLEDELLYHELEEIVRDLHRAQRAGQTPATGGPDREVLQRTMELARQMVAELDPEARVSFEQYSWHGELVLDINVSRHGHEHHYQLTADRARLALRDHELLHHDLEGIIADLR